MDNEIDLTNGKEEPNTEEPKKVAGYVQHMKAEEIVHKVYLMVQERMDDFYFRLMNLEMAVAGLADKDNQDEEYRVSMERIKASVEIMKENNQLGKKIIVQAKKEMQQ